MTEDTDPPGLDTLLCYNVYALNLAFGRFYQAAFGETGFTYPKFVVLLALNEAGPMSLGDLSARVGTEPNTLSPMVKKMSSFGLIDKIRDPGDERRVLLTLLPYGKTVLAEASRVMNAAAEDLGLNTADIDRAAAALARHRQRVEGATPSLRMTIPDPPDQGTS